MTASEKYTIDARNLLTSQRFGVLSTISVRERGFPFGSVVPYDVDQQGRLHIFISLIAEHYKNLSADPRASVTVLDPFGMRDAQASARATALVEFSRVPEDETAAVRASYLERFPGGIREEIESNFVFMRGAPERIRWIGGFGDIGWISGERYAAASVDPLAYQSYGILAHMNDDHFDALVDFGRAHSAEKHARFQPVMRQIDSTGFSLSLRLPDSSTEEIRIPFGSTVTTPEEARGEIIRLLKEARARKR